MIPALLILVVLAIAAFVPALRLHDSDVWIYDPRWETAR